MPTQPLLPGLALPCSDTASSTADDLRDWPNVTADVVCRNAKQLGAAAEALFDSQMHVFGQIPLPVAEFLPFDRILLRPSGIWRVQIKSITMPTNDGYALELRRGYRCSPQGMRRYAATDYDLLAIVLLRENVIRFYAEHQPRYHIPFSAIRGLRLAPRASFDAAVALLEMQREQARAPRLIPAGLPSPDLPA